MGGAETFQKLKGIDPKVRVLLSSGYSLDGEAEQVMAAGARGFIQKPYRLAALSHKVAEILGTLLRVAGRRAGAAVLMCSSGSAGLIPGRRQTAIFL